ncbi:DUF2799 domain-containing protein [Bdellovibrio sp. HCB337]|uniref:DUF2799 domain-containing protein n=1 Tax=Bdellovibrio sp. HCB337 TaxID=3394358 RepID=UPI0039A54484
MKKFLFAIVAFNLVACASYFKKKECESVNWFEHGKSVALRGEWLNSDKLVGECRKVEADIQESQLDLGFKNGMQRYCTADNSYQTGKKGDVFSRDLCEGPEINSLLNNYRKGITDYCAKTNGQNAGASGKKYQNVCPKELEPAFLVEYRKGRKKYVLTMIETRQTDVREMETKLYSKRTELSISQSRLSSLQSQMSSLETQKNFTPQTNTAAQGYLDGRISALSSDLSTARHQVSNAESDIASIERERQTKVDEIANYKAELPSLDQQQ